MKKAIIYCRVSSDRQVAEGHGMDGQERMCRSYAETNGYNVIGKFGDEGVSGGVVDRPGMKKMLAFLDKVSGQGDETIVIIDDIKRWARDVEGHFALKTAIMTRNATLESPTHRFEESPEGKFVETVMAGAAELERNQNKQQVCRRMKARLEAGYWTFYQPPGYTYAKVPGHGKIIVPKEPEANIIREALEGFASGRFETQVDVQQFLQSKGFNHWGTGKMTYLEQVKRLLTREVYAGYIYYPKWNVTRRKGHHEALITPDTFQKIQDRLAGKQKNAQRKDIHKDFPLRGFVLCAHCKQPMTAGWTQGRNQKYPYYRCRVQGCTMRNKNIRKDDIETQFEKLLSEIKPQEKILEVVRIELLALYNEKIKDVDAMQKRRSDRLRQIKDDIDTFCERIKEARSPAVINAFEEKIESLEAEKLRLGDTTKKTETYNIEFEPALHRVMEFIKDPLLMWKTGDLAQKRLVLRIVFDEPLVFDAKTGFYTASLSLPVAISCTTGENLKYVVEMPGIEPGSNV